MNQKYLNFALHGMSIDYVNPYGNLPATSYPDSKPSRKNSMTNKQKKSRAAAKRAKKARRAGR